MSELERYQKERQVWAEKKKAWVQRETQLKAERDLALAQAKDALDARDALADELARLADDPHELEFYQQGQTGVEHAPAPEPDESSPAATTRSTT
jgi:hypothetical protein